MHEKRGRECGLKTGREPKIDLRIEFIKTVINKHA